MSARDTLNPRVRRAPWRLRLIVAIVLGSCLIAATAVMLLRRPAPPAANGQPATATATVERRTLVDYATFPGDIGYGPEQTAQVRLTGTITKLAAPGSTVQRGGEIARVDDKSVVLLFGDIPSYRTLTAGRKAAAPTPIPTAPPVIPTTKPSPAVLPSKGADVKQFEQNLRALGYGGFTVDEDYTEKTAAAVRRWQRDLGLPPTGDVELGRIFYAGGPIRVATQKATLGGDVTGPLLTYTGTTSVVVAKVPILDQGLAKPRTAATVELPDGTQVAGSVTMVRAPSPDDPDVTTGQDPVLQVVVGLRGKSVDGTDGGVAKVRFVSSRHENVLVVPVTALLALSEGGYGVQVEDDGTSLTLPVTPGLFADGMVEVTGPGLRPGMRVGVAQ